MIKDIPEEECVNAFKVRLFITFIKITLSLTLRNELVIFIIFVDGLLSTSSDMEILTYLGHPMSLFFCK